MAVELELIRVFKSRTIQGDPVRHIAERIYEVMSERDTTPEDVLWRARVALEDINQPGGLLFLQHMFDEARRDGQL